jgi:hypothetical protein
MDESFWEGFQKEAVSLGWAEKRIENGIASRLKGQAAAKIKAVKNNLTKAQGKVEKAMPGSTKELNSAAKDTRLNKISPEARSQLKREVSNAQRVAKKPGAAAKAGAKSTEPSHGEVNFLDHLWNHKGKYSAGAGVAGLAGVGIHSSRKRQSNGYAYQNMAGI